MQSPSLKVVVVALSAVYALAGIAGALQLREEVPPQPGWTLLAAFWAFLAVSLWRLSAIARTTSILLLLLVVLLFTIGGFQPLYLPEFGILITTEGLPHRQAIHVCIVAAALAALLVLVKNKSAFR